MKKLAFVGFILVLSILLPKETHAVTHRELDLRMMQAREIFTEFTVIPERSIPKDMIKNAKAIFIIPGTVKGGFLFAMKYGKGVVLVKDADGNWSAPAFIRLSGGSFGFQVGAHWTDLILLAKRETAVNALLQNRLSLGGNVSVAFGPWGRHTEINTDWQISATIFAYSRTRGLFAALATDGTIISLDTEANELYYGPNITLHDIIYKNNVEMTPEAQELKDAIQRYDPEPPRWLS